MTAVMHPSDRLLADVAPFRKAHGALFEADLRREVFLAHVVAETGPARLDAENLGSLLAHALGSFSEGRFDIGGAFTVADHIGAEVGADGKHGFPRKLGLGELMFSLGQRAPDCFAGPGAD